MASQSITEEEYEEMIENRVNSIQQMYKVAKQKKDYDLILKKFNIKVLKNGKTVTPMYFKIELKKKIIEFTIHEPEDYFDLDSYNNMKNK